MYIEIDDQRILNEFNEVLNNSAYLKEVLKRDKLNLKARVTMGLTEYVMIMIEVRRKDRRSQLWDYMNRQAKLQSDHFESDYRIITNEVDKYNIIL